MIVTVEDKIVTVEDKEDEEGMVLAITQSKAKTGQTLDEALLQQNMHSPHTLNSTSPADTAPLEAPDPEKAPAF